MAEHRKSDFNAERLPYLQGFLLASHWNTDGRILDRVLRNLLKTNGEPLSNQRIADALRLTGLPKAGGEIERFVVRGETIELRPRIWGDCAAQSALDVKQFDMGFDLDESRKTGIIQGIRESGNAWEAGVRNGHRWAPSRASTASHPSWRGHSHAESMDTPPASLPLRPGASQRQVHLIL
jgi:predicted metalloprotease with PDZ domain